MKLSELTIPSVEACSPGIEPLGAKVLVAPVGVAEKIGSIILANSEHEKKVFANQRGVIVAMSPAAFKFDDWPADSRTPQVGDVVLHEAYIGDLVEGEDGKSYRLMNDRAVQAVLQRRSDCPETAAFQQLPVGVVGSGQLRSKHDWIYPVSEIV